ncbi:eisosome protein SEG2-like [Capsicum annuum]|uniref:eisosome protein SEG2-like n=1 Tax=Capsicum annuum TaxID=4072 RepID=UPI001FB0E7CE|nr:eisosome protein SEG2-like [Capsicum annuum]
MKSRWTGPFTVVKVFPYGDIEIKPDGDIPFKVNEQRMKHYMGNLKKDDDEDDDAGDDDEDDDDDDDDDEDDDDDDGNDDDTSFELRSKVVTRIPIKWDEIDFPKEWILENAAPPQNNHNSEILEEEQAADGTVNIKFSDSLPLLNRADDLRTTSSLRLTRSTSSYISPVDYIVRSP